MSKGVQMGVATLAVFAAVAWIVGSNEGSFQFFASIDQLSQKDLARASGLRIRGWVVDGSISRDLKNQRVDFAISDTKGEAPGKVQAAVIRDRDASYEQRQQLRVRYEDLDVPDLFADGAEVVVEGGFRDGVFMATRILAKCPSKYQVEPALPERKA